MTDLTPEQLADIPLVQVLIRWAQEQHYYAWSEGQGSEPPAEWAAIIGPPRSPHQNGENS